MVHIVSRLLPPKCTLNLAWSHQYRPPGTLPAVAMASQLWVLYACVRSSQSRFLKVHPTQHVPPAQRTGLTSLVKTRPPTDPHHSPRGDTFHLSNYALLEAQSRLSKEEIGGELELPHTLAFSPGYFLSNDFESSQMCFIPFCEFLRNAANAMKLPLLP